MPDMGLLEFIAHLGAVHAAENATRVAALERAARIVEAEAKAEIGTYQAEAGPFAAWAELADFTKEESARLGYPPNEPLLRDGTLRDSIAHVVSGHEAVVGSPSDIAVYQELGTHKIPPRSFLGGALVRKTDAVVNAIGETFVGRLLSPGNSKVIPHN